jgi:hypothetical protein
MAHHQSLFAIAAVWAIAFGSGADGRTSCKDLDGSFAFNGTVEVDNTSEPITFLQMEHRPSRRGIEWVRLRVDGASDDALTIEMLDAQDLRVGELIALHGECKGGTWYESDTYDGNSDGTRVTGQRAWQYSRNEDGSLLVSFSHSGNVYYLPLIQRSFRSSSVSRFERR